jgi:hypothetical protein
MAKLLLCTALRATFRLLCIRNPVRQSLTLKPKSMELCFDERVRLQFRSNDFNVIPSASVMITTRNKNVGTRFIRNLRVETNKTRSYSTTNCLKPSEQTPLSFFYKTEINNVLYCYTFTEGSIESLQEMFFIGVVETHCVFLQVTMF